MALLARRSNKLPIAPFWIKEFIFICLFVQFVSLGLVRGDHQPVKLLREPGEAPASIRMRFPATKIVGAAKFSDERTILDGVAQIRVGRCHARGKWRWTAAEYGYQ